jgi:hypothetical protein
MSSAEGEQMAVAAKYTLITSTAAATGNTTIAQKIGGFSGLVRKQRVT